MKRVQTEELGLQQRVDNLFIPIVPAAIPHVLHIAAIEHAFDHEACLGIIVQLVEVDIPENAAGKDRMWLLRHAAKLVASILRAFSWVSHSLAPLSHLCARDVEGFQGDRTTP